jgi:hypothetical protein
MFHLVGYETSASEAALTAITPIPDPTVAVISNDIRIPTALPNVVAVAPLINSAAATLRAQLVTPSLRAIFPFDCSPISNGLVFPSTPPFVQLWDTPIPLIPLEPMDMLIQNGAAVMNRAFVWLADGPIKPTTGKMYSIRATATATLVTASWVNSGAITFASTLPAGHYQCVGLRSWSANQVAARIFFVGYPWRPGVIAGTAEATVEWPVFRWGNNGVYGEFDNTVPPTIDFMGITDTAENLYLDLIKTA